MSDASGLEFRTRIHAARQGRSIALRLGAPPEEPAPGAVPRVARLLALARHYQALIARGEVRDFADLAHLAGVTRARITQIMDLLLLAPDVQEAILDLPRVTTGRDWPVERKVRAIAHVPLWSEQRENWERLVSGRAPGSSLD